MSDHLDALVARRCSVLGYLVGVLTSEESWWCGTVRIVPADIEAHAAERNLTKQVRQWFALGMSLSPLLEQTEASGFLFNCAELFSEYADFENKGVQKLLKLFNARTYRQLRVPSFAMALSFVHVAAALCDILVHLYRKFVAESYGARREQLDALMKLDSAILAACITPIVEHLSRTAQGNLARQLGSVVQALQCGVGFALPQSVPSLLADAVPAATRAGSDADAGGAGAGAGAGAGGAGAGAGTAVL